MAASSLLETVYDLKTDTVIHNMAMNNDYSYRLSGYTLYLVYPKGIAEQEFHTLDWFFKKRENSKCLIEILIVDSILYVQLLLK